jgi:hypothetical protein
MPGPHFYRIGSAGGSISGPSGGAGGDGGTGSGGLGLGLGGPAS